MKISNKNVIPLLLIVISVIISVLFIAKQLGRNNKIVMYEDEFKNKYAYGILGRLYRKGSKYPYTGIVELYYKNGNVCSREYYKDGCRDGNAKYWHDNGILEGEYIWNNGGLADGIHREYFRSGQIKLFMTYVNNNPIYCAEWYENGQKKVEQLSIDVDAKLIIDEKWDENGNNNVKRILKNGQTFQGTMLVGGKTLECKGGKVISERNNNEPPKPIPLPPGAEKEMAAPVK